MAQVAVGQVWTFKSAPTEAARVVIQKVEPLGNAEAVHISVYGLPAVEGVFAGEISHLPFEREALEASLDKLTRDPSPAIDVTEGYKTWKAAKGGIFTISVAEAVQIVLDMARGRS